VESAEKERKKIAEDLKGVEQRTLILEGAKEPMRGKERKEGGKNY